MFVLFSLFLETGGPGFYLGCSEKPTEEEERKRARKKSEEEEEEEDEEEAF